ncbi:MAG TPA: hypothetical protein VK581_13770, partial [Chthoniobacterales bacterium]|nr:hypothetical protein [Chthoniobacterales bacterium]
MSQSRDALKTITRLFRTQHYQQAEEKASVMTPAFEDFAEIQTLRVRSLMEVGQFKLAAMVANKAAQESGQVADACALRLIGAYATTVARPAKENRDRMRELAAQLAGGASKEWQAFICKWDARLLALEVELQMRPIYELDQIKAKLSEAATLYTMIGRGEDGREEQAMLAEIIAKGPPAAPLEARRIWERLRRESEPSDTVMCARVARAMAEIDFEAAMQAGNENDILKLTIGFQEASRLYLEAGFCSGDAEVKAALGRAMIRFGLDGTRLLKAAGENWEQVGRSAFASGVWTDLSLWHSQRGELAEAEVMDDKKLRLRRLIESDVTLMINALQTAHAAYVRGDFAEARDVVRVARANAIAPFDEAALLMNLAGVLVGINERVEAARTAAKAVALLEPSSPCASLGDALFQLALTQDDLQETRKFCHEAIRMDEACGRRVSGATRLMSLAEIISQPRQGAVDPVATEEAEQYYERAEALLGQGRDLETVVARSNLAQRRGQTALYRRDFDACGHWFSEAERLMHASGRNADFGFLLAQEGLALLTVAGEGTGPETYNEARSRFEQAEERFGRQELRGPQLRMLYLSGATALDASGRCQDAGRTMLEAKAEAYLERAAKLMEQLRGGRRERDLLAAQSSREDFALTQEAIYDLGFRIALKVRRHPDQALLWLERMKSRALLDSMAEAGGLVAPATADPGLTAKAQALEEERAQIAKEDPSAQRRWFRVTEEIEQVWDRLGERPETAEYASLRRGRPVGWPQWRQALQHESASLEARGRSLIMIHFVWPLRGNPNQRIHILACRGDWESPRAATVDTRPEELEGFAQNCFGAPGGSRSTLRAFLSAVG